MKTTKSLSEVKIGDIFSVSGIEFIKFSEEDGAVVAVAKNTVFDSVFGENNNYAESTVRRKLEAEILPKLEAEVGAENVIEFETDLISLDGSEKYGKVKSKISLPTIDFYRKNVKTFDKHKLNSWWWLATPDSTTDHANDSWVDCVSPLGDIPGNSSGCDFDGVRPFLIFVSSISVSCEE